MPLRPGTHVLVGIKIDRDRPVYDEAMILNIVTFEKPVNDDRDKFFLISATDSESWAFIDEKKEQFAMSFHAGRSNVWGVEDKIHISKDSGTVVEVHDDHITAFHKSGSFAYVDGNEVSLKIGSSFIKLTPESISIKSPEIHMEGVNLVTIEGSAVQINDGIPVSDQPKNLNDVAKPSIDAIKEINDKDKEMFNELKD
jgi:hypothetical protein